MVDAIDLTESDHLWFVGDLTDRGPSGPDCVRWVRDLCSAPNIGCVMGNHDALLVGVARFGDTKLPSGNDFMKLWDRNGGIPQDLEALSEDDIEWLAGLPAMAIVEDVLIVHADSEHYARLGDDIETVNDNVTKRVASPEIAGVASVFNVLCGRRAFESGASKFRERFGGRHVVHGHTPIPLALGLDPRWVTHAHTLDDATNVDGGMYLGGPGFVHSITNSE